MQKQIQRFPHVSCLGSAASMFASRTPERWVRLKGGQRVFFFEEPAHLRLSHMPLQPATVIVALKALLLFHGFH